MKLFTILSLIAGTAMAAERAADYDAALARAKETKRDIVVAISNQTSTATTTVITQPPPNPADATVNVGVDPLHLRDIVIAGGSPFLGQSTPGTMNFDGTNLRSYSLYPAR